MTHEQGPPGEAALAGASGCAMTRGAFTIVNGIACGLGGACGVDLRLAARVEITSEPGEVIFRALGPGARSGMDDGLAKACIRRLLSDAGDLGRRLGARVETVTDIPASRGLKSSSAAANAILLAGLQALGRHVEPMEVVQMGVDCAIEAGVTLTGAFDDAVATMFGGAFLTDNEARTVVCRPSIPEGLRVLFLVPQRTITKATLHREDFAPIREEVRRAFELARSGDVASAITLNGRAYAPILGVDCGPVDAVIAAGAWAAGMSGTGPAIAVLTDAAAEEAVLDALAPFTGTIVRSGISTAPGMVLSEGAYQDLLDELSGGASHG